MMDGHSRGLIDLLTCVLSPDHPFFAQTKQPFFTADNDVRFVVSWQFHTQRLQPASSHSSLRDLE